MVGDGSGVSSKRRRLAPEAPTSAPLCDIKHSHDPCDKYTYWAPLAIIRVQPITTISNRIEIIKRKLYDPPLLPISRWYEWSRDQISRHCMYCNEIGDAGPSSRMLCILHVRTLSHGPCLQTLVPCRATPRPMDHPRTPGKGSREGLIETLLRPGRS